MVVQSLHSSFSVQLVLRLANVICLHFAAQREAQEEAQRMKLCRKLMQHGPSCVCAAFGSQILGTTLARACFLSI